MLPERADTSAWETHHLSPGAGSAGGALGDVGMEVTATLANREAVGLCRRPRQGAIPSSLKPRELGSDVDYRTTGKILFQQTLGVPMPAQADDTRTTLREMPFSTFAVNSLSLKEV